MSLKPAQIADNINGKLERLMPVLYPLGVVLGFVMPEFFYDIRHHVPALFGLITLAGTLKLKFIKFDKIVRKPLPIFLFLIVARVLMPLIAMLTSKLFFGGDPNIVIGFVLLFSGPMAMASFISVRKFRGDRVLCLTLFFIDTVLTPIAVPVIL